MGVMLYGAALGVILGAVSFVCLMVGRVSRARELRVWLWWWVLPPIIGVAVIELVQAFMCHGVAVLDFLGWMFSVSYGMLWFGVLGTPLAMLAAHFRAFRVILIALTP